MKEANIQTNKNNSKLNNNNNNNNDKMDTGSEHLHASQFQ